MKNVSELRTDRGFRFFPAIMILFAVSVVAHAQSVATAQSEPLKEQVAGPAAPGSADVSATGVNDRLRALEDQLRMQAARLDEMRALVTEQQRIIAQLTERSAAGEKTAANPTTEVAAATTTQARPATQDQPVSIDDRLKKLETRVLAIGPFRFSGDFRLRFDGIFRQADPDPPAGFAPLTHQQNARMRYRLRLNLDTDINQKLSFHTQFTTGPINNPLTVDQDFGETTTRHPFFINEAWIDFHPNKALQLQAGRVLEIFADNSRFLFDDDVRFSGFNEKYTLTFKNNALKVTSVELRAGQYIFSNPNVAIVTAGSPLAQAGAVVGSTGRSANLFHQGVLVNQSFNEKWSDQFGGDVQLYRHPNQIQLASTADGVVLLVQPGLGITLSGPLAGTGNATTTPGGAIYTAPAFQIGRLTYKLNYSGFQKGGHNFPVTLNLQVARNFGTGLNERDAMLAALQIGKITKRGDTSFLYVFSIKGANALISQVTDDDLGQVNIKCTHEIFHQVMGQRAAWLHFFQCDGNGLCFKPTDDNRQAAQSIHLSHNNGV